MNSGLVPQPSLTPQQACDAFLKHELARIRSTPENQPDAEGNYTELFWSLVVGLSKTRNLNMTQSMDMVHHYLCQEAPNLSLPTTLDAGPERMQRLQKQIKAYHVETEYGYDPAASATPADFARTRKTLLLIETIMVGGIVMNHFSALHDGSIYLWALFLFPMIATICLAGLVDPRIFWSVTKGGENMPVRFKILGGVSAMAGVALSIYLAACVYHVWG